MTRNAEAAESTTPPGRAPVLVDPARVAGWIAAHEVILDELRADLVRRSIVHLSAVRDDLVRVLGERR